MNDGDQWRSIHGLFFAVLILSWLHIIDRRTPMEYRLHYRADADDANQPTYETDQEITVGQVIELEDGFHYCVLGVHEFPDGGCLDLSKSAQSPEEARLLAEQHEHL